MAELACARGEERMATFYSPGEGKRASLPSPRRERGVVGDRHGRRLGMRPLQRLGACAWRVATAGARRPSLGARGCHGASRTARSGGSHVAPCRVALAAGPRAQGRDARARLKVHLGP
jgi:hypothetical protein